MLKEASDRALPMVAVGLLYRQGYLHQQLDTSGWQHEHWIETDPDRTSAFLNVRVADIHKVYEEWSAKGAEFLTEPKDHGREIRAYIRDPDGHLIEVGQTTGRTD